MTTKRITCFILIVTLILSLMATVFAAETNTTKTVSSTLDRADALYEMGLFAGTNNGYELEKLPTRTQAVIFLLRMLGEEKAAQDSSYTSPFTDVPDWAAKSIAYAYNKGYTNGVSEKLFGSNQLTNPTQFVTFMLRALGYNDKNGDFVYSEAVKTAESLDIIPVEKYTSNNNFNRGDCVDIIYDVLSSNKKGESKTLAESLIEKKAIDGTIAAKYGFSKPIPPAEPLIDLSSKTFSYNERVSITSHKPNDMAAIKFEIIPKDIGIKASNVYLSEDGVNYKLLKMGSSYNSLNKEEPFVQVKGGNFYEIYNLQFNTSYTVCVETSSNIFVTPFTVKTVNEQASYVNGYGTGYVKNSDNGIYTEVAVEINVLLEGKWSYQFYRWTPGSKPVAISGASGVVNGPTQVSYEPTSKDLYSYVYYRLTNEDGVIIENDGRVIEFITGMTVQED